MKMKLIGLVGNIASGKSLVAAYLKEFGAAVLDADQISRELMEKDMPIWREIVSAFGSSYLMPDSSIDRKKLGELIFGDEEARRRLNQITHPKILAEAERQIEDLRLGGYGVVVLEAALLIEIGYLDLFDEVWLVKTPKEQIYAYMMKRDHLTLEEAKSRLAVQRPAEEQEKSAHRVIENNGTAKDLKQKISDAYRELTSTK